jgi:hypothetical protein
VTEADLGEVKDLVRRLSQVLEPAEVPPDIWAPLGLTWWAERGRVLEASPAQVKFAAALFAGCQQARAARLAGYQCSANGRRAGHKAACSVKVQRLLEQAEDAMEARRRYGGS